MKSKISSFTSSKGRIPERDFLHGIKIFKNVYDSTNQLSYVYYTLCEQHNCEEHDLDVESSYETTNVCSCSSCSSCSTSSE